MAQSLPKSNEHTIQILDKYYPTIEDIFRNTIYPRLLLLPNMPQTLDSKISGAFGDWNVVEAKKREIQSTYWKVEKDRGFKCNVCGKTYCFDCLFTFAPSHSTTGRKVCFFCGGNFSEL